LKYGYARFAPTDSEERRQNQLELLEAAEADEMIVEELPGTTRRKPILESLVGNVFEVDNWRQEYAPPERVVGRLKAGDEVVTADLSRIGNNIGAARRVIDEILHAGAAIHLVEAKIRIKSSKESAYRMLKAASDAEWRLHGERTALGFSVKKARGQKFGRPEALSKRQVKEVYKLADSGLTQKEVRDAMRRKYPDLDKPRGGLSQPTISRLLQKRARAAKT